MGTLLELGIQKICERTPLEIWVSKVLVLVDPCLMTSQWYRVSQAPLSNSQSIHSFTPSVYKLFQFDTSFTLVIASVPPIYDHPF